MVGGDPAAGARPLLVVPGAVPANPGLLSPAAALLYAFPLLFLGDGEGAFATLSEVFGWAFAIWGIGLYWWAGLLYAWQVRKLLADRDRRAPSLAES